MFTFSRLRRSATLGALACTLFAASTGAVAAAATQAGNDAQCRVQLGDGLPSVPCYHDPAPHSAAQAQEHYYPTYGEPDPITASVAPAPADGGMPWLTIALAAGLVLAAGSIVAIHRRRLQLRRGMARVTT